jgi:hypothetical protein
MQDSNNRFCLKEKFDVYQELLINSFCQAINCDKLSSRFWYDDQVLIWDKKVFVSIYLLNPLQK